MAKYKPTAEQIEVIEHQGSHALVSAVAGAGKTTTMVERITQLIRKGVEPRRIIAIQYNKSAQVAMQQRLRDRIPGHEVPQARTFHSIGYAMMKKLIECGALKPAKLETSPAVHEQYMRTALRTEWKRVNGRDAFPSQEHFEAFKQFVTRAKADTRTARDVFQSGDYQMECAPFIAAISLLDQMSTDKGICFFDDLLSRTNNTLNADPDLWKLFADRIDEIIVDELQDTNPVQYAIIRGLAGTRSFVMGIGDTDQTIYSFRGADPVIMSEKFAADFSPCKLLRLTTTFRYGPETAMIANHVISKNLERDDKIAIAAPTNADTRVTMIAQKPKAPSGVVPLLRNALSAGTLHQNAMLVRFYSSCVPYEIELAQEGIPFFTYGREPLLLIKEIASLVAALSLAVDYWVVPELTRQRFLAALLLSPTVFANNKVVERAAALMDEALVQNGSAADALVGFANTIRDDVRLQGRIKKRADVIRLLEAGGLMHQTPAKIIATYLTFSEFKQTISHSAATPSQGQEIEQNVAAFTDMASRYSTAQELLDTLGPLAAHRSDSPPQHQHLQIRSIHAAKGMEWSTVFLPGWAAGTFPRDSDTLEEERRLAYVAITRAVDHLVILHPDDETLDKQNRELDRIAPNGSTVAASRFLYEGEIGLCREAAEALRTGSQATISCRRDDIVNRYMKEAGVDGIFAEVPPEIQQRMKQTNVNSGLILQPGQRLRAGAGAAQIYEVTSKVGDRFYYVSPLTGGDPRLISLDEAGWVLA